jgi:phosphoglycolate phosphatase-like HAD superfamily hydrolase
MRVRVIFFDMDGTLVWVPGGGQADWIAEKLKDAGIEPDGEHLVRAYKRAQERWQSEVRPRLGFSTESFIEWNLLILRELGSTAIFGRLPKRFSATGRLRLISFSLKFPRELEKLRRRGIALGIVSHRPIVGLNARSPSTGYKNSFAGGQPRLHGDRAWSSIELFGFFAKASGCSSSGGPARRGRL